MPVLKDFRQTKTITLPSWPDSKVEIYDSLLVGQMVQLDYKDKNEVEIGIKSIPLFIKSWNFTNEDGKELEINFENISFLKQEDLTFMFNEITAMAKENKKKLTDTPESLGVLG